MCKILSLAHSAVNLHSGDDDEQIDFLAYSPKTAMTSNSKKE